jgi:hypothetical protein
VLSRPCASRGAGLPGRILGRLVEVFLDRTVILAGQTFSAILPLFMMVRALGRQRHPAQPTPRQARLGSLGS